MNALAERSVEIGHDFVESHAGLFLPESYVHRPTGIDLFAGCGGMSLGTIQAGFRVVAAVDNDCSSAITYMHNLGAFPCKFHFGDDADEKRLEKEMEKTMGLKGKPPHAPSEKTIRPIVSGGGWISHHPEIPGVGHFFFGDVRNLSGLNILDAVGMKVGEVNCVFGGPPCQGFSTSGKRNVADPRNNLVFEFARLILEIQPKTMVMENVPGILSMKTPEGVPVVDAFCRILSDGDFAPYDALRKSLAGTISKGGTVFRDSGFGGKKNLESKKGKASKKASKQKELFK